MAFFDEEQPVEEAPFKKGDKVFVIDNEGDGNDFVNHVVTVDFAEATGCRVTDGNHCQWIKCENLRKVKN